MLFLCLVCFVAVFVNAEEQCRRTLLGKEYTGHIATSKGGYTCQRWDSQSPHKHLMRATYFPDASLSRAENYCRNPDDAPEGPWCYTTRPEKRWEYCNIPYCDDVKPMIAKMKLESAKTFANEEHKLLDELFTKQNYEPEVFPFLIPNNSTVTVSFGMGLIDIVNLDETGGTISLNAWIRMMWTDFRLKWDPANFGGVQIIRVNPSRVWKPDIYLYNSAVAGATFRDSPHQSLVYSDGTVLWIPPAHLVSLCHISLKTFPFDEQECILTFGSWTFDGFMLGLDFYEGRAAADTTDYVVSAEWEVLNSSGRINKKYYPCCPEPYPDVTFTIRIRRRGSFYSHVYVGPAVMLALLIPFEFLLPPETSEKTTLGVGIMISLGLMLLALESLMGAAVLFTPVLVKFYLAAFVLTGLSQAFTALVTSIWWCKSSSPPPEFIFKVASDHCAKVLLIRKEDYLDTGGEVDPVEANQEEGTKSFVQKARSVQKEWRLLAIIFDRLLLIAFLVTTIVLACAFLA